MLHIPSMVLAVVTRDAQRLEVVGVVEADGVAFVLNLVVRDGSEASAPCTERIAREMRDA